MWLYFCSHNTNKMYSLRIHEDTTHEYLPIPRCALSHHFNVLNDEFGAVCCRVFEVGRRCVWNHNCQDNGIGQCHNCGPRHEIPAQFSVRVWDNVIVCVRTNSSAVELPPLKYCVGYAAIEPVESATCGQFAVCTLIPIRCEVFFLATDLMRVIGVTNDHVPPEKHFFLPQAPFSCARYPATL